MPKPSKQTIIDNIVKAIEQGKAYSKVLSHTVTKWHMSKRTFDRYWKTANDQHTANQAKIKEAIAEVDMQAAIEARKKAILTADERKELLTQIARGEIKIKKPFVIGGKIMEYPAEPDHADRKAAIAELNKMEGNYAPSRVQNQTLGADGQPVDPSPPIISLSLPPGIDYNLPSNTDSDEELP